MVQARSLEGSRPTAAAPFWRGPRAGGAAESVPKPLGGLGIGAGDAQLGEQLCLVRVWHKIGEPEVKRAPAQKHARRDPEEYLDELQSKHELVCGELGGTWGTRLGTSSNLHPEGLTKSPLAQ